MIDIPSLSLRWKFMNIHLASEGQTYRFAIVLKRAMLSTRVLQLKSYAKHCVTKLST
jgi:hypothetical protein